MTEPQATGGRSDKGELEQLTDPLTRAGELAEQGDDGPVELDDVSEDREDLDGYQDDPVIEWEPDYDEDAELEPDDEDDDPDHHPGHHQPRLAPGPKHGPDHHHGHGPGPKKGPGKKAPGKKVPGKKAPGKKAPDKKARDKKAPGPKKHHGHPPPPPHEDGPEPDFGPGPGWGFGPDVRGRRPGRRGRPGDVRAAILALLAERPMHGYEMIQQIAERSRDRWRPSPGSVYPTLQLLGDEGLITGSESAGSKKLFELTEEGRAAADKVKTPPWQQFSASADSEQVDLRTLLNQLFGAVGQVAYAATVKQQHRVAEILKTARRQIFTLLAEADEDG